MNPLLELKRFGQSVWYDNITRGLLKSGSLLRMMEDYGVTGVTSNPTIFEKAVAGSADYDADIKRMHRDGLSATDVLGALTAWDVRLAADILKPVFEETAGLDGYVSIEVNPHLARDRQATIKEASYLRSLVNRPNVMIKVPATAEGVLAMEELVYQGYNVNVTLLFSVKRYEEAARAYVRAIKRRLGEGKSVADVFGVASFFVSRVDTLIDGIIAERLKNEASGDVRSRLSSLTGRTAVANAKLAYVKYNELFGNPDFSGCAQRGARPQRLLWGSTGTKNPVYSDVKYVDSLIEKDTINTMPLQTLTAFHDHGIVRASLGDGLKEAEMLISGLSGLGVDYDRVTSRLEQDGVKAFIDSYDLLLDRIKEKTKAHREDSGVKGVPTVAVAPLAFDVAVQSELGVLQRDGFSRRLWEKDATLWKEGPTDAKVIKGALGWLAMPGVMPSRADEIIAFADGARLEFDKTVLLGMGGSSLAPFVLKETFGSSRGFPELVVLDSTDPEAISAVVKEKELKRTLFIVASKSGTTIEPNSFFHYFYERLRTLGVSNAGRNFIAITDPGTAMEGFARKYGFRKVFLNPPDIGGRYSALSFFGLVPAAVAGIDIKKLLYHAACVEELSRPEIRAVDNGAQKLGAALGVAYKQGRDKVTFVLSRELSTFGLWIEQLIAESTGKEGRGIVPISGEPLGGPKVYGSDRIFVYVGLGSPSKVIAKKLDVLQKAGHPVIRITLGSLHELGGEFLRWEIATAVAGRIIGINPFDQPDVELAKRLTIARLEKVVKRPGLKMSKKDWPKGGLLIEGSGFDVFFGSAVAKGKAFRALKNKNPKVLLKEFFASVKDGDYIAILAYLNPLDAAVGKALKALQKALRDASKKAVQCGFGPRYLHSTGQLHKGGADNGVFIMMARGAAFDMDVPETRFSFSTLFSSQAMGDLEALDSRGRRVVFLNMRDAKPERLKKAWSLLKEGSSADP